MYMASGVKQAARTGLFALTVGRTDAACVSTKDKKPTAQTGIRKQAQCSAKQTRHRQKRQQGGQSKGAYSARGWGYASTQKASTQKASTQIAPADKTEWPADEELSKRNQAVQCTVQIKQGSQGSSARVHTIGRPALQKQQQQVATAQAVDRAVRRQDSHVSTCHCH